MNFRFLNVPVHIRPGFWLFLIFFANLYIDPSIEKLIVAAVLLLSLLVHEFGHALTALFFGARPLIVLEAFGGFAQYDRHGLTPKQQFLITLNGPLLESLLIAIPYYLLKMGTFEHLHYVQYALYVMMRLNIVWCLLNLIPIVPLDGGYLALYFFERKFGIKGYRASFILGLIAAAIVVPILYIKGFVFFATLLLIYGFQNFQVLMKIKASSGNPFSSYINGVEALKNNEVEKGKTILKKLLKSKDSAVKHSAIESVAKLHLEENEADKAYEMLLNADPSLLKEGKCILCRLAFERQNYELVGKHSRDIYELEPTFEIAVLNAKAFGYINEPALAAGWLETASLFGEEYADQVKAALEDTAFNSVRDDECFQRLAERLTALSI
ncbi:MAG: hypothetical protein JSS30_08385 [Verrucomicrobia bacterium]|nr:hypothetical protein [Verrucomicrobiota bacterium]